MNKTQQAKHDLGELAISQFKIKQNILTLKAERNILFPECTCGDEYTTCYNSFFQENISMEDVCPPMVKAIGIAQAIGREKSKLSAVSRKVKSIIKKHEL